MTTYWIVETYTKKLISKVEAEDGLDQTVYYAKGAPNEQCYLEVPALAPNESDDYFVVDGDPDPEDGPRGAVNLSLDYYEGAHKNALLDDIRAERDKRLAESQWLVQRHKDETDDTNTTPTWDGTKYQEWLDYRQALRDLPETIVDSRDFDWDNDWPTEPAE